MKPNTSNEEVRAISAKRNAKEEFNNEENLKFILDDYGRLHDYEQLLYAFNLDFQLELRVLTCFQSSYQL